jgi:WS/DGAT/MGAT family acyltransferase
MGEDRHIDLDYHVRHSALPAPGGERELGELVSRLHGQTLDRSRPLWTCHVIEGLEGNRFALYTKIHHALADGIRGMQMVAGSLGTRPAKDNWKVPWAPGPGGARPNAGKRRRRTEEGSGGLRLLDWPGAIPRAMAPLLRRVTGAPPIRLPFEAPRSVLNVRVTGARRVATQRLDLRKVRRIAGMSGASINDVFLAICSRRCGASSHRMEGCRNPRWSRACPSACARRAATRTPATRSASSGRTSARTSRSRSHG